jgi:hypothetical protein
MSFKTTFNPFTGTIDFYKEGTSGGSTYTKVTTYSNLPDPITVPDSIFIVLNSEGTRWLPGSLGGTYYQKGLYHSNGSSWSLVDDAPYQATQSTVNQETIQDEFVSPFTLGGWLVNVLTRTLVWTGVQSFVSLRIKNIGDNFYGALAGNFTSNRTISFQDKSGTVAYLSDIVSDGSSSWLDPVISNSIAVEPLTPNVGDRYLIPSSGVSGLSWEGNENKITEYNGEEWVFTTPVAGNVVVVNSLSAPNNQFQYQGVYNTGSWVASSIVSSFLQGGNSFGGPANIGTNDNQDFNFKTNNIVRATINKLGDWFFTNRTTHAINNLGNISGTVNWNLNFSFTRLVATGNITLDLTNVPTKASSASTFVLYFWQGSNGGRTLTLTAGKFRGTVDINTAGNSLTVIHGVYTTLDNRMCIACNKETTIS